MQFSIKSLECKEQKLMLASSRRSDSRAGKKKYDEEKKKWGRIVFSPCFPCVWFNFLLTIWTLRTTFWMSGTAY